VQKRGRRKRLRHPRKNSAPARAALRAFRDRLLLRMVRVYRLSSMSLSLFPHTSYTQHSDWKKRLRGEEVKRRWRGGEVWRRKRLRHPRKNSAPARAALRAFRDRLLLRMVRVYRLSSMSLSLFPHTSYTQHSDWKKRLRGEEKIRC
jgi:hypothetical protein